MVPLPRPPHLLETGRPALCLLTMARTLTHPQISQIHTPHHVDCTVRLVATLSSALITVRRAQGLPRAAPASPTRSITQSGHKGHSAVPRRRCTTVATESRSSSLVQACREGGWTIPWYRLSIGCRRLPLLPGQPSLKIPCCAGKMCPTSGTAKRTTSSQGRRRCFGVAAEGRRLAGTDRRRLPPETGIGSF